MLMQSEMTVAVPVFFRIAGHTQAMHTCVLSPDSPVVPAGYCAGTNLTEVDRDLVSGNIAAGITLFGVDGALSAGAFALGTSATEADDRVLYEMSDMIYHSLVLLAARGLTLDDLEAELARRFK